MGGKRGTGHLLAFDSINQFDASKAISLEDIKNNGAEFGVLKNYVGLELPVGIGLVGATS